MCPGLVGGYQGTALAAIDDGCKFHRIPNFLSSGDGVRSDVDGPGVYVSTRDHEGSEPKSSDITPDDGSPIPNLYRTSQRMRGNRA